MLLLSELGERVNPMDNLAEPLAGTLGWNRPLNTSREEI